MSESEEPVAESTAFPEARQVPIPATTVWSSRVWWVTLLAPRVGSRRLRVS